DPGPPPHTHGADSDRPDRDHPAHRHREEERDHDDRLCPRRRAPGRQEPRRRDLPGMPAALPPDHDDHDGGPAQRPAPGREPWGRGGAAATAWYCHRRWVAREPAPDPLHDAGHLSRLRSTVASRPGNDGMNLSALFIARPVATTLLTVGLALTGAIAFSLLPVAPLPQVDFPTIQVQAALPGASPETMATSVAAPLERQLGHIAAVTEMTSTSNLGSTAVVLQFDLNRDINGAARDVQAAINAARGYLPSALPNNPTYRKVNPADAPILILGLTSDT